MLKRYERTRVLVEGDSRLAHEIVRAIEEECSQVVRGDGEEACPTVRVLDEPHEQLVMVQARETAQGTLFYLSEALMTSCRVSFDGAVGYGFVLGADRCLAYELAVIDAAFAGADGPRRAGHWEAALARAGESLRVRDNRDAARVAATRVDFSTLGAGSGERASEEEANASLSTDGSMNGK